MQVYRGMDIGTAKPTPAERAEIPHHLIDLADPSEDYSIARFQQSANQALAGIEARGRRALLVGGSALYVRALVDELTVPGQFPEARTELEAEPDTAALHARLAALDPVAAARMEPGNRRRVVRALEVTIGSGRPFSSYGPGLSAHPPSRFRMIGLAVPNGLLARRIEDRLAAMVGAGLVDEVQNLAARPEGLSRTARQALGYREVLAHGERGAPLAEALDEAARRTRAFARRQRAWFRRDPRITWVDSGDNPFAALPALLGEWDGCRS
jgi:tRNA dimethylallyltransferase